MEHLVNDFAPASGKEEGGAPDSAPASGRLSPHRAPPISLPADPAESAALVLRYVQTAEVAFDRSAAIEAMTARTAKLADPTADVGAVVAELAGHATILDALFQRWAAESVRATVPDHKTKFAKLALASQASYTRTLIAIEGLKQQAKGRARLTLNDEPGDSEGDE
jgi:hypothetical protein